VLLASCPGAPFGAKLVGNAGADITTGAVLQALMASIAAFTFADHQRDHRGRRSGRRCLTAVGDLIKTVAFLQIIPFVAGIAIRHWTPSRTEEWNTPAGKIANNAFLLVVIGATLGSWQTVVDLVGSRALIAALIFAVLLMAIGYFAAPGPVNIKQTVSLIMPNSNAGPAFAAVAIAFDNDPVILGSLTAFLFVHAAISIVAASWMGKEAPDAASAAVT